MVIDSSENPKFTWGDTVIIKKNAPAHLHPGEIVSVCSVVKIDPEDIIKDPSLVEPTWLYTLEFGDGSSIELPECYLEEYVDRTLMNAHKYILDFKKTLPYFMEHIQCDKSLSEKIVKTVNFREGGFYTFLTPDANINTLYNFEWQIIPSIPVSKDFVLGEAVSDLGPFHIEKIVTMNHHCSEFINDFLKRDQKNFAIVENYVLKPESLSAKIENVKMIPYKNEVYFLLDKQNSVEDVYKTIKNCFQFWHYLIVLTRFNNNCPRVLNEDIFNQVCLNAEFVITGAYDGDAYIFWEKNMPKDG